MLGYIIFLVAKLELSILAMMTVWVVLMTACFFVERRRNILVKIVA